MKNAVSLPYKLREDLIDFVKRYNYFLQSDCIEIITSWIENDDIDSIYYFLKPCSEEDNLHITCSSLSKMDLNAVYIFYQNSIKKAKLLEKKTSLFEKISEIRRSN